MMTDTSVMAPVMTRLEVCDNEATSRTPAEVYIQFTDDPASALMLCGHHFDKNRAAIMKMDPFIIHDERLAREG
jgi:hypothetical protein